MCYEERFFLQRTTAKVQKREEPESVIDPLPQTDKPKEVELELETV